MGHTYHMNYCSAHFAEALTSGPSLITVKDRTYAVVGTRKGNLITIPLIFSPSEKPRDEYTTINVSEGTTINLKELFLDQEYAQSVVSHHSTDHETHLVALQDGQVFHLTSGKKKKIYETQGAISAATTFFSHEGEYIAIVSEDRLLAIIDTKGKPVCTYPLEDVSKVSPEYCDQTRSITIGLNNGNVINLAFDGENLTHRWTLPLPKPMTTSIVSAQLFGKTHYFAGNHDRALYCITDTGAILWRFQTDGRILAKPFIDDVNNDDIPEILFGSCDDRIYVLSAYGKELWNYETDFWVATQPGAFDVNFDDYKEVFVGSYDNSLYCFSPEPEFVPSFFSGASGIVQQSGSFESVDVERTSGFFAKTLFTKELDGMIVGMSIDNAHKIVAAITDKGEFRAIQFS